jgi:hypothetical protein
MDLPRRMAICPNSTEDNGIGLSPVASEHTVRAGHGCLNIRNAHVPSERKRLGLHPALVPVRVLNSVYLCYWCPSMPRLIIADNNPRDRGFLVAALARTPTVVANGQETSALVRQQSHCNVDSSTQSSWSGNSGVSMRGAQFSHAPSVTPPRRPTSAMRGTLCPSKHAHVNIRFFAGRPTRYFVVVTY